jgi:hypothetical protein
MALTVCMKCDRTYLLQYDTCPHCGDKNPGVLGAAQIIAQEMQRELEPAEPPRRRPMFWTCYLAIVQALWTSPWFYIFVAAPFIISGGKINHPERVIPGILFLGLIFFPAMGYLYFLAQRAAKKRGYEL